MHAHVARLLGLVTIAGCATQVVQIPPNPQDDQAPTITIVNFVPGSNGEVDKPDINQSGSVYATIGTQLMVSANAKNPLGGVKTFSLTISQDGMTRYRVTTSVTPNASNQVPNDVSILGSDGNGGAGTKEALLILLSRPATLSATAENFHGMSTTVVVTYVPLGPLVAQLSVTPTSVPAGSSATLSWSTTNATAVSIVPPPMPGPLPLVGSAPVAPAATTTFKLTATQPFSQQTATFVNPPWVGPPFVGPPPANAPLQTTGETQHATHRDVNATLTVTPPPPPTGGIAGSFFFDVPTGSSATASVTLNVAGKLVSPSGSVGLDAFTLPPIATTVFAARNQHIDFSIAGLKKGTWSVTARADITGPRTCTVVVPPGLIALSVAASQAPCSPP